MKTTIKKATKQYPYLAVYGFEEIKYTTNVPLEDIVLVSKLSSGETYVQYVNGGQEAYKTKNEEDYQPLPQGFEITIVQ